MGKRKSDNVNSQASKRNRKLQRNEEQDSDNDDAESCTSMDMVPASQPTASQIALSPDRLKRSGKVLKVRLQNFMCHRNLVVDFNARTNLVIGANGSGKSAILTALIIGLGSKANATNRSTSIIQFIRTGESAATIEVHLTNDGGDSYERERYGDKIIVVRHITSSGTSTYKLQNANGRTLSTSRTELLKMALFMNIQVDNPVCVMTQDSTRSFLRDSNAKMQYKLFMKATQLDIIIERLNDCVVQLKQSRVKYEGQKQSHEALVKEQEDIERKVEQFQSMEPLRAEIRKCKVEALWRKVVDQENLMEDINTTHADSNRDKSKLETELAKWSNVGQIEQEIKELRDFLKTASNAFKAERERLVEAKTVWKQKNEDAAGQEREMKKVEARCTKIETTIQKLEETIRNEVATDKDRLEQMRQENETKLTDLKDKQSDLEATIKSHTHEKDVFEDANTNYRQQIDTINNQRTALQQEKQNVQQALKTIRGSADARLRHIAPFMPDLIDDLEKGVERGELSAMPIGPFANHIEVVMPKYRQHIEDVIGKLALAFCVDNDDDATFVRELFPKYSTSLPIITTEFTDELYDTSGKGVERNNHSIRLVDAIRVNSTMVMNCLIDMCAVDTILLTENGEYAKRITSIEKYKPANLSRIICTNPYSEYYPVPMYRTYSKQLGKGRHIRVSEADSEKTYKNEMATIIKRLEELDTESENLRAKITENNKHIDERKATIVRAERVFRSRKMEIDEMEAVEYQEGIDTTIMAQEIAEQTKLLEQETERYEAIRKTYDAIKAEIRNSHGSINELKKKYQEMEQEIQDKQSAKEEMEEKVHKCESMTAHYQKKIQTIDEVLGKLGVERSVSLEKLKRLELSAEKAGQRINNPQTEEQLEAIIRRNERKINAVVACTETFESILEEKEEITMKVLQSYELLQIFQKSLTMMSTSVRSRFQMVSQVKNEMKTRISTFFVRVMALRKCDASLEFNDAAETLKMEVSPRDKQGDKTVSKLTNLSGGERSYVTVAFLLSLWACVDHPFYFLDEYDVFTDEVNRSFMTQMLLREAARKPAYQYTFLTPQDISDISVSSDLSILRLDKPDR